MFDTVPVRIDRSSFFKEKAHGEQRNQYPRHDAWGKFRHKHAPYNEGDNCEVQDSKPEGKAVRDAAVFVFF